MLTHLACIMDGNRRWSVRQQVHQLKGYHAGMASARRVITFCLANGIPYLSLYACSIENLQRSEQERYQLFSLINVMLTKEYSTWKERGIRVCFIGNRLLLPEATRSICEMVEQATQSCSMLTVYILLCYGGRQELVAGVQQIAQQVEAGNLRAQDIDEDYFRQMLWTRDIPSVDLLIRTGRRYRISNFLLYQTIYSELYFLDCLWPDLTSDHLKCAIDHYYEQQRTFGL